MHVRERDIRAGFEAAGSPGNIQSFRETVNDED